MEKSIKKKWLSALRSGKYTQGRNALKKDGKFCCLGVLCDLHSKEHTNKWKTGTKLEPTLSESYIGETFVLPEKVIEWAGLDSASPNIGKDEEVSLAERNDAGKTFKEIADLIQENL